MSPAEALVQGFTERCVAMSLSTHEMVSFFLDVVARCSLRYDEVGGGPTLVARKRQRLPLACTFKGYAARSDSRDADGSWDTVKPRAGYAE